MKRSELKQSIHEEIQNLFEVEVNTTKFEFSHGRKPRGNEEWAAPGRLSYGQAVAKAYAKKKGIHSVDVMP